MRSETIDGDRAAAIVESIRTAAEDREVYRVGLPEPGWHRSTVDPAAVVDAAEGVSLGDRWRIDCYQFNDGLNRWPRTIAVPSDDSADAPTLGADGRFKPPADAVELSTVLYPEGSNESFFARSWLLRELRDLGAVWHPMWWLSHDLLKGEGPVPEEERRALPIARVVTRGRPVPQEGVWTWTEPRPADFGPTVQVTDSAAVQVTFCTVSFRSPARIVRHCDTHRMRDGLIEFSETDLATSDSGYMV